MLAISMHAKLEPAKPKNACNWWKSMLDFTVHDKGSNGKLKQNVANCFVYLLIKWSDSRTRRERSYPKQS